jgi:opacity protein-like surface antigen
MVAMNLTAAGDLGNAAAWNRGALLTADTTTAGATATEAEGGFAAPAAQKIDLTETDTLRWQVAIGPSFVRFHSKIFNASMAGTYTSVAWSANGWLAVEGQVMTGFAPEIYLKEHVKYLSYGGGVLVGSHRARWEPFAHVLVGGAHLQPQTAGNSRNAFMMEAGGGADYQLWPRMSLRGEIDYLRTQFFKSSQNDFQATLGVVFHF